MKSDGCASQARKGRLTSSRYGDLNRLGAQHIETALLWRALERSQTKTALMQRACPNGFDVSEGTLHLPGADPKDPAPFPLRP